MKKLNFFLVKLLQFVVFAVFTFVVITYFGALVLLPLDAIAILVKIMGAVGIHGFVGAFIAIPAVGYLCLMVYKTPGLCQMIVDTGLDLIKIGKAKVDAFNPIADAVKG
jgi:choline-glycine betaine transporter